MSVGKLEPEYSPTSTDDAFAEAEEAVEPVCRVVRDAGDDAAAWLTVLAGCDEEEIPPERWWCRLWW